MMTDAKTIGGKREAVQRARALPDWTTTEWVQNAEEALRRTAFVFFRARLAHRNGPKRFATTWMLEFERELASGVVHLLVHPVAEDFDRRAEYEAALERVCIAIAALRHDAQAEYRNGVGVLRRPLHDDDDHVFRHLARHAASIFTRVT